MTKPTTLSGSRVLILVGNGAGPETFAAPCGLTTKAITFSAASSSTNVPDCDDPDAPSWTERDVTALSGQVTGSGVLATESFDTWNDWFQSGESKNCRIKLDNNDLGYWEGAWILSSLKVTGEKGNRTQIEVSLDSDGEIPWVAAA